MARFATSEWPENGPVGHRTDAGSHFSAMGDRLAWRSSRPPAAHHEYSPNEYLRSLGHPTRSGSPTSAPAREPTIRPYAASVPWTSAAPASCSHSTRFLSATTARSGRQTARGSHSPDSIRLTPARAVCTSSIPTARRSSGSLDNTKIRTSNRPRAAQCPPRMAP